ncbi:unnamed protein product [Discosporangium mesarthrocarpum]
MRLLIIITIGLSSFIIEPQERIDEEKLHGHWTFADYKEGEVYLKKRYKFKKNKAGIEFRKNGKLVKRQNIGWCGTPPITYDNYDGKWWTNEYSEIVMKYKFWGGEIEEYWEIVEVNKGILIVKIRNGKRTEKE